MLKEEIIMDTEAVPTNNQFKVLGNIGENEQALLDGMHSKLAHVEYRERHSAEVVKRKKKPNLLQRAASMDNIKDLADGTKGIKKFYNHYVVLTKKSKENHFLKENKRLTRSAFKAQSLN